MNCDCYTLGRLAGLCKKGDPGFDIHHAARHPRQLFKQARGLSGPVRDSVDKLQKSIDERQVPDEILETNLVYAFYQGVYSVR